MLMTLLQDIYSLYGWNNKIFIFINQYTQIGIIPKTLYLISQITDYKNFVILYICISLYLLYRFKNIEELSAKKTYFSKNYLLMVQIGIQYTLFIAIFASLKHIVNFPRPFCSQDVTNFTTIANIANERCLSSFPSAHAGICFFLLCLIWRYLENRILCFVAILLLIITSISRISLAMHYPSDIIASIFLTILSIKLGTMLHELTKKTISTPIGNFIHQMIK